MRASYAHRVPRKARVCGTARAARARTARGRRWVVRVRDTTEPQVIGKVTPAYLDVIAQGVEHRRALERAWIRSRFMAVPLLAHGGVVGSLVFISTKRRSSLPTDAERPVCARRSRCAPRWRLRRRGCTASRREAIRLRDDVLSVVAHDLRNPLGTILLQVGLLQARGTAARAPNAGRPARRASNAPRSGWAAPDSGSARHRRAWRAAALRIEPARLATRHRRSPTHVASATRRSLQSASLSLQNERRREDLPESGRDRERFLQVFENLIGNAISSARRAAASPSAPRAGSAARTLLGQRHRRWDLRRGLAPRVRAAVAGAQAARATARGSVYRS